MVLHLTASKATGCPRTLLRYVILSRTCSLFADPEQQTADTWSSFADDANAWNAAFTDAWNRFAVIGNKADKLQDCSSLIPQSSASKKRQAAVARFTKRMSAKFRL